MKQEDKDLLLKDLCSRLPYGVKVDIIKNCQWGIYTLYPSDIDSFKHNFQDVTPYLRPMESMTEDELKTYNELIYCEDDRYFPPFRCSEVIEWLDKNMFDHRGLIPNGLAIEVTEENNPYEY